MSAEVNTINSTTRFFIVVAIMSATLMQVLDTTIVNVALPHMQGSLSATPDQVSWTLTCYLVSSAVFMPLTGFFSDILGRKKYLLLCILGFTLASILCGVAQTLTEMVIFRLLQGLFGAGLVPLSQAILTSVYPKEELGKAMAIWGAGVMVGPILGPTIGGYLTEIANWRWTFYVNVPVGIFAFLLAWQVVPETTKKNRKMDWIGLALISFAIGALQFFLDRGNQEDWLNSTVIKAAAVIAISGFVGFIFHNSRHHESSVFDVRIFKNRNFTAASVLLIMLGMGMFGVLVLQPMLLEGLLDYPVLTAGLAMAPRGICSMISIIIVGKIGNKVDPRILIGLGIVLNIIGMLFGTYYSANIDMFWVVLPMVFQGFGMGMIFVSLSVVAFATLSKSENAEAAGLFSLLRTIGSSIGIAVTLTLYTRHNQISWNQLGGFVNKYNPNLLHYLQAANIKNIDHHSISILAQEIYKQAQMITFVNVYQFMMWSFILMLPFVLAIKYKKNALAVHAEVLGE